MGSPLAGMSVTSIIIVTVVLAMWHLLRRVENRRDFGGNGLSSWQIQKSPTRHPYGYFDVPDLINHSTHRDARTHKSKLNTPRINISNRKRCLAAASRSYSPIPPQRAKSPLCRSSFCKSCVSLGIFVEAQRPKTWAVGIGIENVERALERPRKRRSRSYLYCTGKNSVCLVCKNTKCRASHTHYIMLFTR